MSYAALQLFAPGSFKRQFRCTVSGWPISSLPRTLAGPNWFRACIIIIKHRTRVTLRSATMEDLPEVEALIRRAVIHGEGFALDEFQDGFFNRKFIRASHTLVVVQPIVTSSLGDSDNRNERVLGAALFGPSALCRSVSTPTMGGYLIVHPEFRRQGFGKSLLCAVEDFARSRGFTSLMSDAFVDNITGHLMARKSGFVCTGSIHQCATTANAGLVDSLMYHKYLIDWMCETCLQSAKSWRIRKHECIYTQKTLCMVTISSIENMVICV